MISFLFFFFVNEKWYIRIIVFPGTKYNKIGQPIIVVVVYDDDDVNVTRKSRAFFSLGHITGRKKKTITNESPRDRNTI